MTEHWTDFFVAQVGATAALAGLLFVSISINLQRILEIPPLVRRAADMLTVLVGALLVCSVVLIPAQPARLLAAEIGAIGVFMWAVSTQRQLRRLWYKDHQTATLWISRLLMTQAAILPIIVGAGLIFAGSEAGLYCVAAGILGTMAISVVNAWVLLVEIMR